MLFYERDGIDIQAYLPKLREPSVGSAESVHSDSTGKSVALPNGTDEVDAKKCCVM